MDKLVSVSNVRVHTIKPCRETPKEVLCLSETDRFPNCFIPVITVYESCKEEEQKTHPVNVLKEALSKVLVYYYPLAGRLKKADDGRIAVECNAQGIVFEEAEADCTLEDVGYFIKVPCDSSLRFNVDPRLPLQEKPLIRVQVTMFQCGGFVLAMTYCHAMMDGHGMSGFMKALAEMVNNADKEVAPSVVPVWDRNLLAPRNVGGITFPLQDKFMQYHRFSMYWLEGLIFPREFIDSLKEEVVRESRGCLKFCSTFEALVSLVWQTYQKACASVEKNDDDEDCIVCDGFYFTMNARKLLRPPVSEGYYGNCFCLCLVEEEDFEEATDLKKSDIVKAIRKAKARVDDEYVRSYIDYCKAERIKNDREDMPSLLANKLLFNDWSKFSYTERLNGLGNAACNICLGAPESEWMSSYGVMLPPGTKAPTGSLLLYLPRKIMAHFKSHLPNFTRQ